MVKSLIAEKQPVFRLDDDLCIRDCPDPSSMELLARYSAIKRQWIVSSSELELARTLFREYGPATFSKVAVGCRTQLGQAPLVPTILSDTIMLFPGSAINSGKTTGQGISIEETLNEVYYRKTSTVEEATDSLVRGMGSGIRNSKKIVVFLSGGWDSRLDLALALEVYGRNALVIAHMFISDQEKVIAHEMAEVLGLPIVDIDPAEAFDLGLKNSEMRSLVMERSNWRPTVILYGGVLQLVRNIFGSEVDVIGFGAYALKGRNYNQNLDTPPPSGRFLVNPAQYLLDILELEPSDCSNLQLSLWKRGLLLTKGLDADKRDDYLTWAFRYGVGYSHRLRFTGLKNCYSDRNSVSYFMSVTKDQKDDVLFIKGALDHLGSEYLKVPVLSSDGGKSFVPVGYKSKNINTDNGHLDLDLDSYYLAGTKKWCDEIISRNASEIGNIDWSMRLLDAVIANKKATTSHKINATQILAFLGNALN